MSDSITLKAQERTEFGKGFARRARAAGLIPAVIYGHGENPRHVNLPGHETMMALKQSNALLTIDIEGSDSVLALAKDVQRDPVKRVIEHVDLLLVRKGEKVHVEVPVHVVGTAAPETVVTVEAALLAIEAEATHLPEFIEISVDGLAAGTLIHAKDVVLPKGSSLTGDPEATIVNVSQQVTQARLEADLASDDAVAEPQVVGAKDGE